MGQPASAAGEGQAQKRTNVIPHLEYLKNKKSCIVFCRSELTERHKENLFAYVMLILIGGCSKSQIRLCTQISPLLSVGGGKFARLYGHA